MNSKFFRMKTIDNFNFKNKKALIRVDFNVPLDENFKVTDATRIVSAKPTIIKILEDGGSCVLMSHLGRPKGVTPEFSLNHIVNAVSDIIGVKVKFVDDCIGEKAEKAAAELQPGEVLLLENLRFHPEEEKGDILFSEKLSKLGDIYVNDAFGTAHRAHASTTIVAQFFPNDKCFGYLLAKEIESIQKVLSDSVKPVTAVLGGAKVSSKIGIIKNILDKVDHIIIGGGMAYTFMKAQGGKIGSSLCEEEKLDLANELVTKAKAKGVNLLLPVDSIAADAFAADAKTQLVMSNQIPDGWLGLDIGPEAVVTFSDAIKASKTICWNGPMGVFEMPAFANNTKKIAEAVAAATKLGAFSLVGGGDSVAAVNQMGLDEEVSYVSTGGGAMLTMLEGGDMPGISSIG